MSSHITYPVYENKSGWNALLPKRVINHECPNEDSYDFVIVGAGYTGLAVARRLGEMNPNKQVLLLESSEIGEASSARNSGFIISLPHNTNLSGHTGSGQIMHKQITIYESGIKWLKEIIDNNNINCNWSDVGKYHGAATHHGESSLRSAGDYYAKNGIEYSEVSKTDLYNITGSNYYRYGIKTSHNIFIQPAAFVRGLADSLPNNVELVENCPVTAVSDKSPFLVKTPSKTIKTNKLIIANNGFAKRLGFLKDRLVIIITYAGMTPELDDNALNLHGQSPEWGLIPANRLGTTLRKISNRRFMVRSAYSYETAQALHKVNSFLTDCYKRRYPKLLKHEFEYIWGGATALTRNGASYFGALSENLYASLGCNGAGVLKGSIYGKLLAEMIMGSQSKELSYVLSFSKPSWMPPEPIRHMAVATAIHYEELRAGRER